MKLREIKFNQLKNIGYNSLSIYQLSNESDTVGKEVAFGFFGDVLHSENVIALCDRPVLFANEFFGTLVLRVRGDY